MDVTFSEDAMAQLSARKVYRIMLQLDIARTPIDMDGALHTDFTKSETSGRIKTSISPFVYL